MIADDRRKPSVVDEAVEDFSILLSFDDQVADGNHAVIPLQVDQLEEIDQLVETAMNVSDYNSSTHDYLIKQMVYRVIRPICETCGYDICARRAQVGFRNCIGQANRAHAGRPRRFDAGWCILDHQTLARQQREFPVGSKPIV